MWPPGEEMEDPYYREDLAALRSAVEESREAVRSVEKRLQAAEEWVVVVAFLVGIVLSLRLAAASDAQNAYQEFYPSWHARQLACGQTRLGRAARIAGVLLLFFVTSHRMLWIFFFIATKPFSRAQRTMMLWTIFMGELGVLGLFYGASNDDPFLQIWALLIDAGVVAGVGLVCRLSFMVALRQPAPPEQPKPRRWRLVARQTVAHKPKAVAAAKAWQSGHSALLTDSNRPQFFSDLVHEPGRFRSNNWLSCKLVLTPRRTLLERLTCRAPSVQTLVWRQSTRASSQLASASLSKAGWPVDRTKSPKMRPVTAQTAARFAKSWRGISTECVFTVPTANAVLPPSAPCAACCANREQKIVSAAFDGAALTA